MRIHFAPLSLVTGLALAVAGCGGSGSGPRNVGPPDPPDPPDVPAGNVTVSISALDAFGAPVAGADILLMRNTPPNSISLREQTDTDGHAEVKGDLGGVYGVMLSAPGLWGTSYEPIAAAENRIEFEVALHPASVNTSGISDVSFLSASPDGREMEFSARLYVVEGTAVATSTLEHWNFGGVAVLPCAADCIDGSNARFEGVATSANWVDPDPVGRPLAAALLIDQGLSVNATDPANQRLLAAKYFQTRLSAGDYAALAAFAADDANAGAALLPSQPATIYPVGAPAFTSDGADLFPAIDALSTLVGGRSPLHAAVNDLIDFTESAAPADTRRAVVVLASGGVTDCDTPAACQPAQESLRARSAAAGVSIAVVGLLDTTAQRDRMTLGTLAQSDTGAVFWAQDVSQIPTVFGRIPEILTGRHAAVDVMIRLEATRDGAFVPGHTVAGTLHVVICPWDCTDSLDVPFAVRIP